MRHADACSALGTHKACLEVSVRMRGWRPWWRHYQRHREGAEAGRKTDKHKEKKGINTLADDSKTTKGQRTPLQHWKKHHRESENRRRIGRNGNACRNTDQGRRGVVTQHE